MKPSHLRKWVLALCVLLALSISACTRSFSTPPPSGETPISDPLDAQQATMEAVRSALLTQTAEAMLAAQAQSGTPTATQTSAPAGQPTIAAPTSPAATEPAEPLPTSPPSSGSTTFNYTVQRGEWVYSIARKFNVDPDTIISLNNLVPPYTVHAGDVLKIPSSGATPSPAGTPLPGGTTHIVQAGEWVYSIARKYGVSPDAIIQANNLRYPYTLYPGDRLKIP